MNQKIYLDNNATTKIDKEVIKILINETEPFNPSSVHFYGRKAKKLLLDARNQIASFLKTKLKYVNIMLLQIFLFYLQKVKPGALLLMKL